MSSIVEQQRQSGINHLRKNPNVEIASELLRDLNEDEDLKRSFESAIRGIVEDCDPPKVSAFFEIDRADSEWKRYVIEVTTRFSDTDEYRTIKSDVQEIVRDSEYGEILIHPRVSVMEQMTVDPDDFDRHSDRIETQYSDEISRRCAISRKYYYLFLQLREENENNTALTILGDGGDHRRIQEFLKSEGFPNLASEFGNFRQKRNEADYDIDKSIGQFEYMTYKLDVADFENDANSANGISF